MASGLGRVQPQARSRCVDVAIFTTYADISFRSLVQSFPDALLSISVTVDGQIFQTDVYSTSYPPTQSSRPPQSIEMGARAVVVLLGIRLGIDGVNPIYYETIRVCDSPHLSRAFH